MKLNPMKISGADLAALCRVIKDKLGFGAQAPLVIEAETTVLLTLTRIGSSETITLFKSGVLDAISFLTLAATSTLTNERVLTADTGITFTDGGAGSTLKIKTTVSMPAVAALGDVIYGDATPVWAKLSGQTTTTKKYLSQTGTGSASAVPAWAEVAQADVAGLKTTDSPVHVTVKLSGLSDGKMPYHVDDATGLADGPTKTDVDSAVSLKHAAVTVSAPISLSGQALSLVNDDTGTVTEIDTDTVANDDTKIPTSKAVYTALALKLDAASIVFPFYDSDGNLDTIPLTSASKLPFYNAAGASKDIALTT